MHNWGMGILSLRSAVPFEGGEYQIVIITDGARSLPYKGATKESAKKKKKKNGECDGIALHCIDVYEYRRQSGRSQGPRQRQEERGELGRLTESFRLCREGSSCDRRT